MAMLVEKEPVVFVATIRPALSAGPGHLRPEIGVRGNVFLRGTDVDIVQPELRFIVADGLFRFMPVRNVHIGKTVVVEIKRAATPRPAAPRDAVAQCGLAETAAALTDVEPVSMHKLGAL